VIVSIIKEFNLNTEQIQAFRMVANHAAAYMPDQLNMYMGGMGRKEKTQVLKALMRYFKLRGGLHRLIVVMPTRTAAFQTHLPFGGMNMVFIGDFAQLLPVAGGKNTALYSRTVGMRTTDIKQQESAIGKALLQQVTTVVLLRENMQQQEQTNEDACLRTALENM
ncbi:hypothetical protein J132_04488, partial [Termitomyces sp. J132]